MLNVFQMSTIQGRKHCLYPVFRCLPPVSFKHDIILDMTKLYSFIPVWMTLTFNQCGTIIRKQECLQSLCCKEKRSIENFCRGYCQEDVLKEVMQVWQIWVIWAFAFSLFLLFLRNRTEIETDCVFVYLSIHIENAYMCEKQRNTIVWLNDDPHK